MKRSRGFVFEVYEYIIRLGTERTLFVILVAVVLYFQKKKKMTFFFKVLESNSSYGQYLLYRLKFVDHVT